jgi:hypothetical protein
VGSENVTYCFFQIFFLPLLVICIFLKIICLNICEFVTVVVGNLLLYYSKTESHVVFQLILLNIVISSFLSYHLNKEKSFYVILTGNCNML